MKNRNITHSLDDFLGFSSQESPFNPVMAHLLHLIDLQIEYSATNIMVVHSFYSLMASRHSFFYNQEQEKEPQANERYDDSAKNLPNELPFFFCMQSIYLTGWLLGQDANIRAQNIALG